ncbi:MAG: ATP-binding cassette domain-containing protein [Anaerolineae bacterium]
MVIATDQLTRRFGRNVAVQDVSLDVARGELFALLGPNGAGKTTTVRMLASLIEITSGSASVLGYDVATQGGEVRARVGLLTESPGLYERLSAWDNLMVFALLYDVAQPEAAVERYLKLLELWDRRDEVTGNFSKGMKQKVAVARALLHEPPLVFLDEPTSGLDPASAKTVRDFLAELKSEGRTIFLTTHNLSEAERLADRIAVLNRELVAVDTPRQLQRRLFGRTTLVRLESADGSEAILQRAAGGVDGVQEVGWRGGVLEVRSDDPERRNPDLVAALVGAGARIVSVSEEEVSLEDVYLRLVDEEDRKLREEGAA